MCLTIKKEANMTNHINTQESQENPINIQEDYREILSNKEWQE